MKLMNSIKNMSLRGRFISMAISICTILSACGDDSTVENITQVNQSGFEVISDVSKLPECTKDNDGEMVWVKGEIAPRKCTDSKWYAVTEGSVASTCTTKELKDKSGVKIICGGDSIGVVLNGKDGKDGAKGEKGDKGDTGKNGTDGKDGKNGTNGVNGADGASCTAVALADNSGLKVLCNGDSVGVVLNGKKGADGKNGTNGKDGSDGKDGDDGIGCSMARDGLVVTITCGDKSTKINIGESGDIGGGEIAPLDSEKIAVSLDEVSGVTQKGPFLMGSRVLIREMEDGRTLTQTGNSFNGKILNDKGEFKISTRMLVSQYVMLEATGYYRNEVTGQNSNSELTLFAITDLNDRNVVNINLLTHLEYERVIYLVTQKKMKVRAAKKQAQKEVLGLLNIDATDFSNSEDLNIAGASDEDGALLAFSLMFQGDRSVANLTTLLQAIANDIEKDGTWDDATTRMKIAEWSADADSSGLLSKIRQNVKNWGLSSTVPNFEQFVRNFWYNEYGLDGCTTKKVGTVKAVTAGKHKGSKIRYICKDADVLGNMRWVIANDFEKDTYEWEDSTDGALKNGAVTGKKYVFDKTGSLNGTKGWRLAVAVENTYGGCVDSLYSKIRSYRGSNEAGYYQCQKTTRTWVLVNNSLMIDTQGWKAGDDGFSKWGDSIGVVSVTQGKRICYVYDTSAAYNGWRAGNDNDCTLGLQGCTKGRAGVMTVAEDGNYYNCANNSWSVVLDEVQRNTSKWNCKDSNVGEIKHGLVDDIYFVCKADAWKKATVQEELACRNDGICRLCMENMQGYTEKRDGVMYVCDKKNWREFNCAEKLKGVCTKNDSSVVEACEKVGEFDIDYICSEDRWHAVESPFEYTLAQWNKKRDAYNAAAVKAKANSDSMVTDPRDKNVYRTVVINGKRVFAENLRYADSAASVNLKGQTWCRNNELKNCEIGGRYYSWIAAVNLNKQWQSNSAVTLIKNPHQGICPDGWHIPSSDEWSALFKNVGYAAQQMVGFNGWTAATDVKGFSALPVGGYYSGDYYVGSYAFFWSASEHGSNYADYWYLSVHVAGLNIYDYSEYYGFSVRCIQDEP